MVRFVVALACAPPELFAPALPTENAAAIVRAITAIAPTHLRVFRADPPDGSRRMPMLPRSRPTLPTLNTVGSTHDRSHLSRTQVAESRGATSQIAGGASTVMRVSPAGPTGGTARAAPRSKGGHSPPAQATRSPRRRA